MAKCKHEKEETRKVEAKNDITSGGRWLVRDDGSRVQIEEPTKINQKYSKEK
jgi:hypothetical protein